MLKKIDKLTILLSIFILFIILLFVYLSKVDKLIQEHASYHYSVTKLQLINKNFDNFLLRQATFINYDNINKSISTFEKNIELLNSVSKDMSYSLEDIIRLYEIKLNSIEYFKSQNAQLLHSMHYLFDLNSVILESTLIDKQSIDIVNKTFLLLSKFYINPNIDKNIILNNIEFLKSRLKNNYNIEIDMFIMHTEIDLSRMVGFNRIKKLEETASLDKALENLEIYLDNSYENNLLVERIIVTMFFVMALVILYILMTINRSALKMRDELMSFKTAIENSYNSIVITDADSNITYVNDVAIQETGYSKEELIGQNPRVLKSGINSDKFYKEMHDALNNGEKWEGEFINRRKDGSFYHEKASIMPIFKDDELVNYLAIKLNITDYIEAKREIEHIAYHDSLTSLPNRANIEEHLEIRLKVAMRQNRKIALLFIDLDRFKNINDTLGHKVGDELLIEVSNRMKGILRESDMLSRFGGDEFVVVIEGFDDDYSVAYVCEKILNLFKMPIQTEQHQLNITLSVGVAIFPDDANNSTTLFKYADIAMYKAKEAGKNTYRYYKKELSVAAHDRLNMEQALKVAMQNDEFYIMYQPQYMLSDKTIIGLEALVRWNSESLGRVAPDKFISVCEDIGYILELGLFIFRQSCIDFLTFQKECKSLQTISINISAIQLYQDSFIADIMAITQEVGCATESIILEITESQIMKNIESSMKLLKRLKKRGFRISIDDFGTGYSSLSYLKLFPISELKIDKSFIDNLPQDRDDVAITKAILALSKSMGYFNVAEGIETKIQEQFLIENNCLLGQGYYFCKPQTKSDLINFLLTK